MGKTLKRENRTLKINSPLDLGRALSPSYLAQIIDAPFGPLPWKEKIEIGEASSYFNRKCILTKRDREVERNIALVFTWQEISV